MRRARLILAARGIAPSITALAGAMLEADYMIMHEDFMEAHFKTWRKGS